MVCGALPPWPHYAIFVRLHRFIWILLSPGYAMHASQKAISILLFSAWIPSPAFNIHHSHFNSFSSHIFTIMFGSRLYLVSAVAIAITAVSAIPRPLGNSTAPVLPQRNATTGQRVNSTSSANNTTPMGMNTTIHNTTITGTNGAQAACDRGITQFCAPAKARAVVDVDDYFEQLDSRLIKRIGNNTAPVLPQRNATTGQRVNSTSSANNTAPVGLNTTIHNTTITGTNGAQAACDRGITQFCTAAAVAPIPT
ncbi:hypothetical protein BC629DRAFT_979722 [Irpex lacteus]|nr:hypothetical protein BC629DRAFT_979722 [Irpex lacteus]